ncbi:glucans biosynthesis glucosyltransferase MdoH [Thiohalocapsa sp.]|uniref:glucans biosynthesis glucosyltransferase MdoH n=1 Tax=Thiohalocapsa sp. TaxID=2497641 RepID=UPI0025ECE211|nr:glucans biosynthesis glucosyltransferase MdoH [Thiohalocapsa sp.]
MRRPQPLPAVGETADRESPCAVGLPVRRRRQLFALLVAATLLVATGLMVWTLSAGGFSPLDTAMTALFALTVPFNAIAFWNAVIGLVLSRTSPDLARTVCPPLLDATDRSPITTSTALLACIRNEDAATVGRNLDVLIEGLVASGAAEHFQVYVLSDSHWPEVIAAEEARIKVLTERWHDRMAVTYRRRADNPGFKAGNIRDFCERWGHRHDFMLVLDADSLMAADVVLRMVRTMQQAPQLGILQSLMAGLPTTSAFARPLQFGMRMLMNGFTAGNAWWQQDVGPYWGHNALIRLRPFIDHCHLPPLPGKGPLSGWVLSHDQVEAALMRRAGYEVRVMLLETGSWEETPTTLTEYLRRDLRWCHGNMQYFKLLRWPGLHPVSRMNLLLATGGFIGSTAWVLLMLLFALPLAFDTGPTFHPGPGLAVFLLSMGMAFAPKIGALLEVVLDGDRRLRFGGGPRLLAGAVGDMAFSVLMAPILAVAHAFFIAGLAFGRAAVWGAQRRAVHWVSPPAALRRLWPQTLFGAFGVGWFAWLSPPGALFFSPFFAIALAAVPIAVLTSIPPLGRLVAQIGLWRIPEETAPAPEVAALHLAAVPGQPRPTPARLREAAAEHAD